MSYTPNTWQTGDTITAAKLNNLESGMPFFVRWNTTIDNALDMTWNEIYNAGADGRTGILFSVVVNSATEKEFSLEGIVVSASCSDNAPVGQNYSVAIFDIRGSEEIMFFSASADSYPVLYEPD